MDIQLAELTVFQIDVSAGLGGDGGPGGPGGSGGSGCSGLGGTQSSKAEGPWGVNGASGFPGNQPTPVLTEFDFKAFANAVRKTNPNASKLAEMMR